MNPLAERGVAGHISPLDLASIGWSAATLDERITARGSGIQAAGSGTKEARTATPVPRPHDAPHPSVAAGFEPETGAVIAQWCRSVAGGDRAAFARRLSWDDCDEQCIASAIEAAAPAAPPEWTEWLPRVLDHASAWGAMAGSLDASIERGRIAPVPEPPFIELWIPFVRAARGALDARLAAVAVPQRALFPDDVLAAFERQLVRDVAAISELALYKQFVEFQSAPGPGTYDRFVRVMLEGGLAQTFSRYPVLARHLSIVLDSWVESIVEMARRLEDDRPLLAATFGGDPGPVVNIDTALSDRHHGGRRVVLLGFRSGMRLVYKPRDVGLEHAFYGLVDWLAGHRLRCAPPSLRALPRPGYGWVESVVPCSCRRRADVEAWYRCAGSLLCLAYVLRASDLHHENILAALAGPVLVDAEMLFQPVDHPEDGEAGGARSCLATGLLTMIRLDGAGRPLDDGGLRESVTRQTFVGRRVWRNLRSDRLAYDVEYDVARPQSNVVRLADEVQRPEDYREQIVAAFVETYTFLREQRDALLSASGPLAPFVGCATRVIFRPSDQYGALLYLLAAPRYQKSGLERSIALDSLNRVLVDQTVRPLLWPLVRDERDALEDLDIPRITVATDQTHLSAASGERIEGHFAQCGVEAVRNRLLALCDTDLDRQRDLIETALAGPLAIEAAGGAARDDEGAASRSRTGGTAAENARVLHVAELLGRELLRRSRVCAGGSLVWPGCARGHDLYSGNAGPVLALAALTRVTGADEWRTAARAAFDALCEASREPDALGEAGGCRGRTSVAYALLLAGHLGAFDRAPRCALTLAATVNDARIAAGAALDVVDGAAGSLLAFLALHDATGKPWLLDRARACGERLLASQVAAPPGGRAWAEAGGRFQPGFAHGAAGIAYALAALAVHTHDPRLAAAVADAWEFERAVFSRTHGNWPAIARDGRTVFMTAWCHGAPGIGLARAFSLPIGAGGDAELELALDVTRSAAPAPVDHLCCGNLGRADVLLSAGRRWGRQEWIESAAAIAEQVASRILQDGRAGIRARGFETGAVEPGFLQGLSGMTYQLARLAAPDAVPSVLAFHMDAGRA